MGIKIKESVCPISGFKIQTFSIWNNIKLTDKYSVTFKLIGDNIVLSIPSGNSINKGMEKFLKKRKEFLKYCNLYDKEHIEIKDYSETKGSVNKDDRLLFTEMMLFEKERGYLLGLFGYNGSPLIKWSFEMARRLYSWKFPLLFCKDYRDAMTNVLDLLKNHHLSTSKVSQSFEDKEIENLFYFISELSWDLHDRKAPNFKVEENSPFSKIYQSLALIKSDYWEIIEKQKSIEQELSWSYKEIEKKITERTEKLREQELKLLEKTNILETSLDILSHDTKNHFISLNYEINQISELKLQSSIKESVEEIQDLIMEATGIMSSKKRILSIIEIIENIKVTSKRLPLLDHDRIEVKYTTPEFLFIQTSALFKNAISNLVENALKYTGENNKVTIEIQKNEHIEIRIIDYGKGIPDTEKEKIIERFYRRNETTHIEGSGRGLWITNNIIHQEGGELKITDNPKGGAIFTIHLPAYKVENLEQMLKELSIWFDLPQSHIHSRAETYRSLYQLQGRTDIEDMDSAVFTTVLTEIRKERKEEKKAFVSARLANLKNKNPAGKSIIIVDDSLYVQFYLAKYFTELGWNVIDYQDNGESAVISYKKRKPDYLSLDNNMYHMSGPEAAEKIYEFDKQAKIIFITALGDSQLFQDQLKERLVDKDYRILTKPIYKKDVKEIITNY